MHTVGLTALGLVLSAGTAVQSGFLDVEGGRIFYETVGTGPAVVFVHDGLLHRETWENQFPALEAGHRLVRYDRRGYGRSQAPKTPYSDLKDLHALVGALKVERATLVACSYRGMLAIDYTLEHPEMVSGLALVGPIVSGMGFSAHMRDRDGQPRPSPDAPVDKRAEYWTGTDPWLIAPSSVAARKRARELPTANPGNLSLDRSLLRGPREKALGRLSKITVPVLILAGEGDMPDVHAHAGAIEAGIPGARRVVLTGAGHLAHMEVPEQFNKELTSFLEGLKP